MNQHEPTSAAPSDAAAAEQSLTLGHVATMLWRHLAWTLPVWIVVTAGLTAVVILAPPVYEARASFTLPANRQRGEVVLDSHEETGRPDLMMLNTQRDQLISLPVLRDAIERADMCKHEPYASAADPVKELAANLRVSMSKDSFLLEVRLRDPDRARSEVNLQAVVDAFFAWQNRAGQEAVVRAIAFLDQEITKARANLDAAQKAVQDYRAQYGIPSSSEEGNLAAVRLKGWNEQRTALLGRISSSDAVLQRIAAIEARTRGMPPAERIAAFMEIEPIAGNPLVIETQRQLAALQETRVQLDTRYLPKHPRMIEIDQRIAAKREDVLAQIGQVGAEIAADRRQLADENEALGGRIRDDQRELDIFHQRAAQLRTLEAESKLHSDLLGSLISQRNEKIIQQRMEGATLTLLDAPKVARFPVSLSKKIGLAIALFAGALAAAIAGLIAGMLDRRIWSAAAAGEAVGLPVLARIPNLHRATTVDRATTPEGIAFSEAFRSLRTALRTAHHAHACHVVAVTSCAPGEGKSTVSANLALSLVAMGARVLLVDADLRRPTLHRILEDTTDGGLSEILAGGRRPPGRIGREELVLPQVDGSPAALPVEPQPLRGRPPSSGSFIPAPGAGDDEFFVLADAAPPSAGATEPRPAPAELRRDPLTGMIERRQATPEPLNFIPAGSRIEAPAELLAGPAFAHAVAGWRKRYDIIIIDTPPAGLVSDAMVVAQYADSVLLVAADRVTDKRQLAAVVKAFRPLSARLLGLVYNRDPDALSEFGQSYRGYYRTGPASAAAKPAPAAATATA